MLSEAEYNELKPHRDKILRFEEKGTYRGDGLSIIDQIRQRRGWGAVCYSCEGSKVAAVMDAISLIREYEEAHPPTNPEVPQ